MTISLSAEQVRRLRLRAQHLGGERSSTVLDAVRDAAGLQAQDMAAAALGVRVRSTGLSADNVERARLEERSVVKTWCMRGTLHLVPAEDVRWLASLFAPVWLAAGRSRRERLGLDEETARRMLGEMRALLSEHGPMTRVELEAALAPSELVGHMLRIAAYEGILCVGPSDGRSDRYVLLNDWLPASAGEAPRSREAALNELARRYLEAFGPATAADFAAWSGLPASEVRPTFEALHDELVEVDAAGQAAWLPRQRLDELALVMVDAASVRLLPAFDTYLLGYRSREGVIDAAFTKRLQPNATTIRAAVLADGRVAGTWSTRRAGKRLAIAVELFEEPSEGVTAGIEAEAADVARFLGLQLAVTIRSD